MRMNCKPGNNICQGQLYLARNCEAIPVVRLLDHSSYGFHRFHQRFEFIGGEIAYSERWPGWYHEDIWWHVVEIGNELVGVTEDARPGTIGLRFTIAYESEVR